MKTVMLLSLILSAVLNASEVIAGSSVPAMEAVAGEITDAGCERHATDLKNKVAGRGFTIIPQRPFVVIGDGDAASVRDLAVHTVKWAVDRLRQDYFTKGPEEIIDIWLFKDDTSYRKHAKEFFGDDPSTPFGYYSAPDRALVMNIATGGGTLVHEIVHPFVRADFPDCPAWFNEGLGTLYEQCGDEGGHIRGHTNWRLAGLQEAIRAGKVPSFEQLTGSSEHGFYNEDRGTNYSQARYLCYYLQQKGLLVKFYREFRIDCKKDPTGFGTLKTVLNERDMDAFKKKWESFVLDLTFP